MLILNFNICSSSTSNDNISYLQKYSGSQLEENATSSFVIIFVV